MAYALENECCIAGLDPKEVYRIASRIERAARDARELGLEVFGGSTSGAIRVITSGPPLVVAEMNGGAWNGGDGATHTGDDGLTYGEY